MKTNFLENRILFVVVLGVSLAGGAYYAYTEGLIFSNPFVANYGHVVSFDPDREGGHLEPNLDIFMQGEKKGQQVRLITNSKGFRNEGEFEYQPPTNVFRILFLGDSFVDGMRTDQRDTIGYRLQGLLNDRRERDSCERVEVMISGHDNPANALYYLQEHGWKYAPHLVILGVTLGNDLTWNNYKGGMQPQISNSGRTSLKYISGYGESKKSSVDLLLPEDAFTPRVPATELLQDIELSARAFLARNFYRFSYLIPLPTFPHPSARRRVYAADFTLGLGLFYQPLREEFRIMYDDLKEILEGFEVLTRDHRSELLVVLFPLRFQIYPEEWTRLARFYSLDETKFDLTQPNQRIQNYFRADEVDILDTLPAMLAHSSSSDAHQFRPRGDMHFNEFGQAVVARVLAEKVAPRMDSSCSTAD